MGIGITMSSKNKSFKNMFLPSILTNHAAKIIIQMQQKKLMLVCAESCTGGLVSALFTEISGSSKVIERGYVTYSNEAKIELLGVKKETIENFGAVSSETAAEMAKGACGNSELNVAISITGIAGPDGGSENKPVGLVYIGFYFAKKDQVRKFNFSGNRDEIRKAAVTAALQIIETGINSVD